MKPFSPFGAEAMKLSANFKDEEIVKIAQAARLCDFTIDEFIWLNVVNGTMKVLYKKNRSERTKNGKDTTADQRNVV